MAQEKAKPEEKKATKEEATKAENVVLIGRKPVMNYVVACITFFNAGKSRSLLKQGGGQSAEQLILSNCFAVPLSRI